MAGVLVRRGGQDTDTEGRPREDTAGGPPSASAGEGLRRNQPCLHRELGLGASKSEKVNSRCLSRPVCGALLGRPQRSHPASLDTCGCGAPVLGASCDPNSAQSRQDSSPLPADNAVRGLSMSRRSSMWRDREGRQLWWFLAVDKGGREKSCLLI